LIIQPFRNNEKMIYCQPDTEETTTNICTATAILFFPFVYVHLLRLLLSLYKVILMQFIIFMYSMFLSVEITVKWLESLNPIISLESPG